MWQSSCIKNLAQSSYPLARTIPRAVFFQILIYGVHWQFINLNTSPFHLSEVSHHPNIFNPLNAEFNPICHFFGIIRSSPYTPR